MTVVVPALNGQSRPLVPPAAALWLAKALALEAGYMNQHGFVRQGPDTSDHVAYFAISLNI